MASTRMLVYLVDDDEMYLKTAVHTLSQNKSLDIKSFESGEEALKSAQSSKRKPDVMVLDYFLNSEDSNAISGLEILKKIREEKLDTEVIMLSGQENIDVAVNSVKYGAYDYVVKNKSAFIRVQNNIKRIAGQRSKDRENSELKRFIMWMVVVLAIVLTIAMIFLFDNTFFGLFGKSPKSDVDSGTNVEQVDEVQKDLMEAAEILEPVLH